MTSNLSKSANILVHFQVGGTALPSVLSFVTCGQGGSGSHGGQDEGGKTEIVGTCEEKSSNAPVRRCER